MERFTYGLDILPTGNDLTYGKSSAGMKCTPSGYVNTGEPLDLKKEFCLIVKKDSFEVKQNGQLWYKEDHLKGVDPLIGFKFLKLTIKYSEIKNNPIENLTGIALIKKLAELSSK